MSLARLSELQSSIQATKTIFDTSETQLAASPSREDYLGDVFYAGSLGYFAQYAAFAQSLVRERGGEFGLPLSAGVYSYEPHVSFFFGLPRSVDNGGASFDLHRVARLIAISNLDSQQRVELNLQIGALSSALEHGVPEQQFLSTQSQGDAISAVKALAIANSQGQRIYEITQDNLAEVLTEINLHADVEAEIARFVNAGFNAVAHVDNVTVPGWRGTGYVLYNKITGAASWKISGGKNGSFIDFCRDIQNDDCDVSSGGNPESVSCSSRLFCSAYIAIYDCTNQSDPSCTVGLNIVVGAGALFFGEVVAFVGAIILTLEAMTSIEGSIFSGAHPAVVLGIVAALIVGIGLLAFGVGLVMTIVWTSIFLSLALSFRAFLGDVYASSFNIRWVLDNRPTAV